MHERYALDCLYLSLSGRWGYDKYLYWRSRLGDLIINPTFRWWIRADGRTQVLRSGKGWWNIDTDHSRFDSFDLPYTIDIRDPKSAITLRLNKKSISLIFNKRCMERVLYESNFTIFKRIRGLLDQGFAISNYEIYRDSYYDPTEIDTIRRNILAIGSDLGPVIYNKLHDSPVYSYDERLPIGINPLPDCYNLYDKRNKSFRFALYRRDIKWRDREQPRNVPFFNTISREYQGLPSRISRHEFRLRDQALPKLMEILKTRSLWGYQKQSKILWTLIDHRYMANLEKRRRRRKGVLVDTPR